MVTETENFGVWFWTGILLHEYGSLFHATGPRWENCVAIGNFCFVLESEKCGCQPQRNAINGMGYMYR